MTEALKWRIEAIREEIEAADPKDRAKLHEQLEQAVALLESKGERPPTWARQRLADRIDEDVEAQFDNLPV